MIVFEVIKYKAWKLATSHTASVLGQQRLVCLLH